MHGWRVARELGEVLAINRVLVDAPITDVTKLSNKVLLVHPKNRDGCGVHPAEAHENLEVIAEVGGDPNAVRHAVCIEMSQTMSAFQIEFNRVLIERADGQLAVINGSDRYLTLSCSHMVASRRAALEGCRTHCESISDANGNINLLSFAAGDVCLKELVE